MENIVIISHHLGGIGGVQKFIALIANQFAKDGHNVLVIGCATPKNTVINSETLKSELYETVLLYNEDIFTTAPHKLFIDAFITKKSAKYIQKRIDGLKNPIIIIANPLSYIFMKDVIVTKVQQIIGQIHTSTDFILNKKGIFRAYKFFVKKYYAKVDRVLMLTEKDAEELAKALNWMHVSYIDNPLPFNIKDNKCSTLTSKTAIMLGRLDENKQIDHAIYIFSEVAKKHADWKLLIYGEGGEKELLQKQINKLDMDSNIKLLGVTTSVESVYENATVTLLTSQKEGMPMVLLESMAYGVPVISYNCSPGVENLVSKNCGALIENGDKEAFIEAMFLFIENEEQIKVKGKGAYNHVQEFKTDRIAKRWYAIFNEKMSENS